MDRRTVLRTAGKVTAVLAGVGGTASTAAGQQQQADVSIISTNEPLQGGQWLSVEVQITNQGFGSLQDQAELIVGHDPQLVDTQPVDLASNQSDLVTLGYRTAAVQQTDTFPIRVECADGVDTRFVQVGPAFG